MSSRFAQFKLHIRNWREWEFNPIVIKELRQAVRSWAVTGTLLLFLTVLFCSALVFLIGQSLEMNDNPRIGAEILGTFTGILTVASLVFIPLYVGIRLAAERQESNLDLLYVTTLSPERIIRGKFLCGMYMTALFFSVCMPFMAFTNLLRGVDLPTIVFIMGCLFFAVCAAVQVAIFLACLPISKVFKILLGLFGVINVFWMLFPLLYFLINATQFGIGSRPDFWVGFLTSVSVILAAVVLLYYLSVALISPMSANRALPLRVCVTVLWILSAVLCLAWTDKERDARLLLPWLVVSFAVLICSAAVAVSNHDQLSFRVRRRIPSNLFRRKLAFLFYNGAAGGLVWVVLLMGATYFVTSVFLHRAPAWFHNVSTMDATELENFDLATSAFLIYVIDYALTALFLHRRFFSRRPPRLAGVIMILLPAAWALVPNMIFFFLNRLSWKSVESNQPGNIFNVFAVRDEGQKTTHLVCAAIWLVIMLVLNARWFARQVAHFRPLEREPQLPPTAEVPPVISTTAAN